jgi:2-methylcitrate dehydratase PrpD
MDFGAAVHRAGARLGNGTDSHTIGFGAALPAPSAALVNGTLIHGLDFDDTHIGAIYHATGPALAAALAVGEAEHATGASVLRAYIIGLEVGCRLAQAGAGKFHARGFHPTGIAGTFAAACVTAALRADSTDVLTNALGLCGSQAAGILEIRESWLKRMHPGWAAHGGIAAVTMAEEGFRGPATVLEGPHGLYASHLGTTPTRTELGLDDLGTRWMSAEIALKPYPCCHFTHAFADAAFALLDELGVDRLDPDQVASIECPTSREVMAAVTEPAEVKIAPATIYDALFSVQYVVARALTTRQVDLAAFYDEPLDHPTVLAMAAKITCPPDELSDYPDHFPGEVILRLTDGQTLRRRIPASYGTVERPMSDQDVRQKFTRNAHRTLTAEQTEQILQTVIRLHEVADIAQLVRLCTSTTTK